MKKTMLFGGALMCAGLHAVAAEAQVSDVIISYAADVPNQFAYDPDGPYTPSYVDTGINESFDVTGGLELLPFDRVAIGGGPYAYGFLSQDGVGVSGDGSLSPSGAFEFSGRVGAGGSYVTEFSEFGGSVSIEFTVDSPSPFELSASGSYDNDYGSAGFSLRSSDGSLLFSQTTFLDFDDLFSGTLEPDTYTLSFGARRLGGVDLEFSVIPAPTTSALLALGASVVLRRRR
ncbi:MAG: PEP-CTERM sorting domain-containing protein [Planctomycetota bacterium]